jgi:mono/diheme cytochrome c family protein
MMPLPVPKILQYLLLMLSGFLATAFSLAPASGKSHVNIEFKNGDQIANTLSLSELGTITPAVSLKVFEMHENAERIYRTFATRPVFDKVFGKDWEKAREIVFTSIDGYQPSIPVAKFLAHDAYFAFAREDGTPFTMTGTLQNNEIIQLGPLYLVWDNINSKALLESGAADMPWQIKSVEIKFVAPFPNMSPPPESSAEAQRGFMHFRKHCMACHTINGQGGGKVPELNYPASVVEYIRPEYLKRWIENPQSIRYNTAMPGLAEEIPNRPKVIEELIAYLKAMSTAKRPPARLPEQRKSNPR